uniref:Uncharacterized protein n=1 Tax=Acanthochromis polyacanthus TaxID=80966 RepID=A0A3Q1EAS4_9TELE
LQYSTFVPISRLLARILLARDSATSALSSASSNSCWAFLNLAICNQIKCTHPGLQFLKLFLSTLHSQVFSLIQAMLQVFHCDLQVLLHPLQVSAGVLLLPQLLSHHGSLKSQGVVPAPDLGVQSGLHRLYHPLVVLFHLVDLLVFLCQFSVNFSLHLVQVHLYP